MSTSRYVLYWQSLVLLCSIDEAIIDYIPGGAYNDLKRDQEEQETNAQIYAWLAGVSPHKLISYTCSINDRD